MRNNLRLNVIILLMLLGIVAKMYAATTADPSDDEKRYGRSLDNVAASATAKADYGYGRSFDLAAMRQAAKADPIAYIRDLEKAVKPAPDTLRMPAYIRLVADENDPLQACLTDSLYNEIAAKVIFKVNRTELHLTDSTIIDLTERVLPYANAQDWVLVGIDLRGGASPEGPYDNNVRLAKGRARALHDYLSQHLDSVAISEIATRTVAEDYGYLLWLLERDGDSAAPLLRRIIDDYGADNAPAIKKALQELYGGRYWKRLVTDYFPKVRAARVVLIFKTKRIPIEGSLSEAPMPTSRVDVLPPLPELTPVPIMPADSYLPRQHMLAVTTNALYDFFYMPNYGWAPMWNVGLEFYPRDNRWSIAAQYIGPYYHKRPTHQYFQIRDYHLEVRRYFRPGRWNTGLYAAAYVNANKYGIGLNEKKGWQGEGIGGAIKAGYVLPIGAGRWRVDFHIAVGCYFTRYDRYVWGNPITGEIDGDYYYDWTGPADEFIRRNRRFSWFGPTEIGITFKYDLLFHRIGRGGASFIGKEVKKW